MGIALVIGMALVPIVAADVAMPGLVIGMEAVEAGMLEAGAPIVPAAGAFCWLFEQAPRASAPPITAMATTTRFIAVPSPRKLME